MNFGAVEPWSIISRSSFPEWIEDDALLVLESNFYFWGVDAHGEIDLLNDPFGIAEKKLYFKYYLNLFNSLEMKYCWDRAKQFELGPSLSGQKWLAVALWDAFPHPKSCPVTAGEANVWREKLLKSLKLAREGAYETPQNMMGWLFHSKENIADECRGTISKDLIDCCLPHPHQMLDAYIRGLESVQYDSLSFGKHINSKQAARTHLIRSLTSALYSDVGQPLRRLVALAVSVAFDCRMSEREVIRICDGLSIESAQRGSALTLMMMREGDNSS